MKEKKIDIYKIRKKGVELCKTEGTEHYYNEIEPIELIFALGYGKGFCLGNVIKYAARYKGPKQKSIVEKMLEKGDHYIKQLHDGSIVIKHVFNVDNEEYRL